MRRARELKNNRRSNVLTDKRFSFSRASRLRIYRIHRLIQYFSIAFCPTQNGLPWFSRNRCGGSLCSKFPCCRGICFQVFRSTAIVLNIVKYLFCKWKDSNREWYEITRVEIRQSTSFLSCASFFVSLSVRKVERKRQSWHNLPTYFTKSFPCSVCTEESRQGQTFISHWVNPTRGIWWMVYDPTNRTLIHWSDVVWQF